MSAAGAERRMRVVVCGTIFGQVYLEAFRVPGIPFELAGIVAHGSERSKACARHYGVPLFTSPADVPGDVDIACVVVRSGLLGGRGVELAQAFMARGIHVLQEHPLHHDELAECLRTARRHRVVYRLNSFYVHLPPVRRFITAARALLGRQRALYVDAACGFQVAYALFDILGEALGGVRPWGLAEAPPLAEDLRRLTTLDTPFRSLGGVIAGVPLTLRIQNQLDPSDPDNYAHLLHRITIGTEGGNLTLVNTHGPIVWSARPGFPRRVRNTGARPHFTAGAAPEPDADDEAHLDAPSATVLDVGEVPGYRDVFESLWPRGVARALGDVRRAALEGDDPLPRGQYHLTLCRLWQDTTVRLGPPELVRCRPPQGLSADDVRGLLGDGHAADERRPACAASS